MKLDLSNAVTNGTATDFTALSVNDAAAIDTVIKRVYSRNTTWIQELISNARDTHREAKLQDPEFEGEIHVHCEPEQGYVSVTDQGLGMSHQQLLEVYSVLGNSSRRDDDRYTGAYGYGSKAGLKVSNHLEVITTSHADGITRRVLVGQFPSEEGNRWGIKILSEIDEGRHHGTEIRVFPSPEVMQASMEFLFQVTEFWTDKVFVHGLQASLTQAADRVAGGAPDLPENAVMAYHSEDFSVCFRIKPPDNESSSPLDVLLVDEIPYDIEKHSPPNIRYIQFAGLLGGFFLKLRKPSLVDLTTGREQLDFTERTTKFLHACFEEYMENVKQQIIDALDQAQFGQTVVRPTEIINKLHVWNSLHKFLTGKELKAHDIMDLHPALSLCRGTEYNRDGSVRQVFGAYGSNKQYVSPVHAFQLMGLPMGFVGARRNQAFMYTEMKEANAQTAAMAIVNNDKVPIFESLGFKRMEHRSNTKTFVRWRRTEDAYTGCEKEEVRDLDYSQPFIIVDKVGEIPLKWPSLPVKFLIKPSQKSLKVMRALGAQFTTIDDTLNAAIDACETVFQTNHGAMTLRELNEDERITARVHIYEQALFPIMRRQNLYFVHDKSGDMPLIQYVLGKQYETTHQVSAFNGHTISTLMKSAAPGLFCMHRQATKGNGTPLDTYPLLKEDLASCLDYNIPEFTKALLTNKGWMTVDEIIEADYASKVIVPNMPKWAMRWVANDILVIRPLPEDLDQVRSIEKLRAICKPVFAHMPGHGNVKPITDFKDRILEASPIVHAMLIGEDDYEVNVDIQALVDAHGPSA